MNKADQIFVFVVCGDEGHIQTLHYSLSALRKFSKKEIIVLTDSSRNAIPIIHDRILDFKTPINLSNHQASIFLKTSLYRFLPKGNSYCYLDTDVVALNGKVDEVFNQYQAPITFAPDHCVLDQFSLSALNCGCAEKFSHWENELKGLFEKYKDLSREPENQEKKQELLKKLEEIKKRKWYYRWISLRFNFSRVIFKLDQDNFLDKRKNLWVDKNGAPVLYEKDVQSAIDLIELNTPYRMDRTNQKKWYREGLEVFNARCNHLQKEIENSFQIKVGQADWQHWNGGVFLFDDKSEDFLQAWHRKTMQIFSMPNWKTRDQGTLIATAWEFGLQKQPLLSTEFNFIADYGNKGIEHKGNLVFNLNESKNVSPFFIHVYHHWGDKSWDVWKEVEKRTEVYLDPDESTVNGLWIGKELSKLELLTIHSFLKFGYKFRLWLYEPLLTPLPEGVIVGDANKIIPKEQVFKYKNKNQFGHGKGSVAGFSDVFRYKMLHDFGGWWVDMDVTCLKNFYHDKPYFFRKHHELKVVGNIMKCPKGSLLMKRCYEEARAEVTESNTDWHKPIEILNKHLEQLGLSQYIVNDSSNADKWEITSSYVFGTPMIPSQWNFIHWQNEEWRNQRLPKDQFYFKGLLAQLLMNYALYEPPKTMPQELFNEIRFHPFFRSIRRKYHELTN
jgi:hypothetical protein